MKQVISILLFLIVITGGLCSLTSADTPALSSDDKAFLSDLISDGIPLLYQTPAAMKTGFFQGNENAISKVGEDLTQNLEAYKGKIGKYQLSADTKVLRDQYLQNLLTVQEDIEKYKTLIPTCGSCVTEINEIVPRQLQDANTMNKAYISFCVKSGFSP